ncbi:alkaline phosphatase family protein [Sulfuricurvum sp.]|uniref:alkaline phosphatase family protein n=1 Tax=Sulfuricurvum sp. TaxID=2025608 RepID=UPI002636DF3E|nr:alkaline phosphatase family protein [Sulfuricurvum sp.]MDD2782310.1 alkaline phosphatase family protein [Sulfuricurvum sp.]
MKYFFLFLAFSLSLYATDFRSKIDHIIVIYLENRSFDNLFRGFEGADTSDKSITLYAKQIDRNGSIYSTLPLGEKSLLAGFPKTLTNEPFLLDATVSQEGMIPDMVHRFYQNILQINGGSNNRFVDISDEKGLSMGYHDISESAIWRYAKEFTLCDRFFAAAFGGSFLNHQWLIAARTPYVGTESNISRYVLDERGEIIKDGILTPDGYAVNTIQPRNPPHKAKYADPSLRLQPIEYDTIGDRLSDKNISWSWYSGGFDDAIALKGDQIHYQYHHNPFLYFARYAPNTGGRQHLKDEKLFFSELEEGKLPSVAFFKPSAADNQHPGYASIKAADEKLSQIVEAVRKKPEVWKKSLIIVTYDENGGLWDHVAPPSGDRWGPGTRIPALIISPYSKKGYVDHTDYDTTSILRLIEWKHDLLPLGERKSNNLLNALED